MGDIIKGLFGPEPPDHEPEVWEVARDTPLTTDEVIDSAVATIAELSSQIAELKAVNAALVEHNVDLVTEKNQRASTVAVLIGLSAFLSATVTIVLMRAVP